MLQSVSVLHKKLLLLLTLYTALSVYAKGLRDYSLFSLAQQSMDDGCCHAHVTNRKLRLTSMLGLSCFLLLEQVEF